MDSSLYNQSRAYTIYLHDFLMRMFFDSISKPLKILDFGCGQGLLMHYVQRTFYASQVIGYDHDGDQIQKNKEVFPELTFVQGSLPLPFNAATFDIIYLVQVMHHIAKEERDVYMAEFARIIKPHGYLVIIEPNKRNLFQRYSFAKEHTNERMILPSELRAQLAIQNFKKNKIYYLHPWLARTNFLFLEKYCYAIPFGQLYCLIAQKNNQ